MDLAASSERFNASAELMSGFGAPARTVTPPGCARNVGDAAGHKLVLLLQVVHSRS
jgi:hypothetical protein